MENSILSSIAGKINQEQMIDIKQMTEQQNESIAALKEEIATNFLSKIDYYVSHALITWQMSINIRKNLLLTSTSYSIYDLCLQLYLCLYLYT